MADKKPQHFLRQRMTDRIYYPEPELVHRSDMIHVMGYFDKPGEFIQTGLYEGAIDTGDETDPDQMNKKQLIHELVENLGVTPRSVEGLSVVELRDMVYEIRQGNEALGGESK